MGIQEAEFQTVQLRRFEGYGAIPVPEEKSDVLLARPDHLQVLQTGGLARAAVHSESGEITTPFGTTSFKV